MWSLTDPRLLRDVSAGDHLDDRQFEAGGEIPVALVMPRYAHDGTSAVPHHHVVGDPDRHRLPGAGIHGTETGEDPRFARIGTRSLDVALPRRLLAVTLDCFSMIVIGEFAHERMLRRQNAESGTEQGVRSSGEDFQFLIRIDDVEGCIGTV